LEAEAGRPDSQVRRAIKRQCGGEGAAELRRTSAQSSERGRELDRIRNAVLLAEDIALHEATLLKSADLEAEAARLSEAVGGIASTNESVTAIEAAAHELSAADAATNAVATNLAFSLDEAARSCVTVDGRPVPEPLAMLPIIART